MSERAPAARPGSDGAQVAVFSLLTCLLSWPYWLGVIASSRGALPLRIPLTPFGSFAPAVAALLLAARSGGGAAVRALLGQLGRWRVGLWNYALALCGMAALFLAALGIARLEGALPEPRSVPAYLWVLAFPGILVLGGPLGEELGWRGYALPRLLHRRSPLTASLIVGGMWWLWHLPLFWVPGSGQEDIPILYFGITILAYSTLFTWLYRRTGGSVLLCVLLHATIDTAYFFVSVLFPGIWARAAFGYSYVALTVAAAALVALGVAGFGWRAAPGASDRLAR